MNFRILLFLSVFFFLFGACKGKKEEFPSVDNNIDTPTYTRFRGAYKMFNDMPELHLEAAQRKGIVPMTERGDTAKFLSEMVRLPMELDLYKIDKLTHSVPYLVTDASKLLVQISSNFRDSLISKKLPVYKLVVTSVTRSLDDVASLTKRNGNASHNSAHCYGTTFDISWKRFQKRGPEGTNDVSTDRLKLILGEVLHDLRQRDLCYVVHEKKQACFHITVR